MKKQNYSNHRKFVIGYHVISFFAILALIVGSIINLTNSAEENLYSASLLVLVSFILLFLFYFLRSFALRAQDRAIRAEEKLRYFILTGKALSEQLTMRQIIGLRFAPDEEFLSLIETSIKENLSENEIKKSIKNWKGDSYRA